MKNVQRIPETPPKVVPVPAGIDRPRWSVMIPVYNCYPYIEYALRSVLAQAPGADEMQIAVVDDFSTDGNVEALVQKVGGGRVEYYRQPENRGSLRNFELCIQKARGHYVHILHGDDAVLDGYYREINDLFEENPTAGAAFTSCKLIDEKNHFLTFVRKVAPERGIIKNWLEQIAVECWVQPPSITVRRSVYEEIGSFYAVHYGEDWLQWVRIAQKYPVAYSDKVLSIYRVHTTNITTGYLMSGRSVDDIKKVIDIIQDFLPEDKKKEIKNKSLKNASVHFTRQASKYYAFTRKALPTMKLLGKAVALKPNTSTFLFSAIYIGRVLVTPFKGKKPSSMPLK